jgi:hypothetical protein
MRRKAEEEAASRANGDDENAARRRPGAEICSEFLARDTSVASSRPGGKTISSAGRRTCGRWSSYPLVAGRSH